MARVFRADKFFQGAGVFGGRAEDFCDGGIDAGDVALGIEGKGAGGNIFENGFDELAAAFELLNGLLKVVGELIDLRTGVAELGGHAVEGANQRAEFVVSLFGDLVIEITGGDFASAFGEGLDGHGDLFGEVKGDPENGR